jgi:hypothetical protein
LGAKQLIKHKLKKRKRGKQMPNDETDYGDFQPAAEDIPRSKPSQPELRMKQLLSSQYENQHGIQSTMLYGLSEDGVAYKYQHSTGGWVRFSMKEVPDAYARQPRFRPTTKPVANNNHDDSPF